MSDEIVDERQRLVLLTAAVRQYHRALSAREHGGVAADRLVKAAENIVGEHWGDLPPSEGNKTPERDASYGGPLGPPDGVRTEPLASRSGTASRPQEQPRKATGEMIEAGLEARRRVVAAHEFEDIPASEIVIAVINAALFVSPAAAEGWQTVPVEATKEMYEAGIAAFQNPANRHGAVLDEVYAAYLAAAPPSPAAQKQEK